MTLLLLVDLFGSVVAVPSAFRAQLVDAVANGGDASTIVTCVSGTPCWLDITFQESFRFWVELPYQFKVFVEAKTALKGCNNDMFYRGKQAFSANALATFRGEAKVNGSALNSNLAQVFNVPSKDCQALEYTATRHYFAVHRAGPCATGHVTITVYDQSQDCFFVRDDKTCYKELECVNNIENNGDVIPIGDFVFCCPFLSTATASGTDCTCVNTSPSFGPLVRQYPSGETPVVAGPTPVATPVATPVVVNQGDVPPGTCQTREYCSTHCSGDLSTINGFALCCADCTRTTPNALSFASGGACSNDCRGTGGYAPQPTPLPPTTEPRRVAGCFFPVFLLLSHFLLASPSC